MQSPLQMPVLREHFGNTHDRQLVHRKETLHPFRLHQRPGHAPELDVRAQALQPGHQGRAELVARQLPRQQVKLHGTLRKCVFGK